MFSEPNKCKKELLADIDEEFNEIIKETFSNMREEMLTKLDELKVPEDERQDYIDEFYKRVKVAVIKEFREGLKQKLKETPACSNNKKSM